MAAVVSLAVSPGPAPALPFTSVKIPSWPSSPAISSNPSIFDDLAANPWGEINRNRLALFAKQDLSNDWSYFVLPWLASNTEFDANVTNAITFGSIGAVWCEVSDTLSLGLGGGFGTGLEDNISFFPILVINWEFAKNWTFTTVPPDGFRIGPGASLRWDATDKTSYALVYQYQSDQQRLEENSSVSANGVGELRQSRVALTATYRFTDHLSITGHAGLTFGGEIEVRDSSGNKLSERDFDSSLVFGFEGSYHF